MLRTLEIMVERYPVATPLAAMVSVMAVIFLFGLWVDPGRTRGK